MTLDGGRLEVDLEVLRGSGCWVEEIWFYKSAILSLSCSIYC